MAWRELVAQHLQQSVGFRMQNPGLANFGAIMKNAMAKKTKREEATAKEAGAGRLAAKEATFKAYPQLAAETAGLQVTPEMEAARTADKIKTPSWGQEQKVQSLKAGLRTGNVVIGREFGEPSRYPMTSGEPMKMEQALMAIQDAGLDPSLFYSELELYDVVERKIDRKSKRNMVKLRDGRIIWEDTKELIQE